MIEWDAKGYDVVSSVQEGWGRTVLDSLHLKGDETVMDAGCGSGRVTELLLNKLPSGFVYAVDKSPAMVNQAKERLSRYSNQTTFICSDLCEVSLSQKLDAIFSNAVFHWVLDHDRLFRHLHSLLKNGGVLHAQCGGKGNLELIRVVSDRVAELPEFSSYFQGWSYPTHYADASETRELLTEAGFRDVETSLTEAPANFATAEEFAFFVRNVVILAYLNRLPDDLGESFTEKFVDAVGKEFSGRYWLDYVRLNIVAVRSVPSAVADGFCCPPH